MCERGGFYRKPVQIADFGLYKAEVAKPGPDPNRIMARLSVMSTENGAGLKIRFHRDTCVRIAPSAFFLIFDFFKPSLLIQFQIPFYWMRVEVLYFGKKL